MGIVQGGVQLMNFRDHWFSAFNCVEYFYYFRSRMHFNARVGMVPLGGNTVAIRRELIERVGGWDPACLTEDADIGVRLSALGEPIRVVYDSRWVTREETPHTVGALVRQRTRWAQGFLQVLVKGDWRRIAGGRRRALALVDVRSADCSTGCSLCFVPLIPLAVSVPEAARDRRPSQPRAAVRRRCCRCSRASSGSSSSAACSTSACPCSLVARMPFTYLAFQALIGFSALRAIVRHATRQRRMGEDRAPWRAPRAAAAADAARRVPASARGSQQPVL